MKEDKNEVTTTKERVIKASETCPDARGVLQELFPEVFKEDSEDLSDFQVGDIVKCIGGSDSEKYNGYIGHIVKIKGELFGIEFQRGAPGGHDLDGKTVVSERGWWLEEECMELL